MQLIIYGASSFIGQHIINTALARNHRIIALSRTKMNLGFPGTSIKWSFGMTHDTFEIQKESCAIHLAHDFNGKKGAERTVEQTLHCMKQLRQQGVKNQLYFSSYSAGEHANSLYGRTKSLIEDEIKHDDDITIIRPGLVLGDGGLFGRINKWVETYPVIPLPDGGFDKLPIISIDKLCDQVMMIIEADIKNKAYNLFEPNYLSLRDIVLKLQLKRRRRTCIINIPSSFIIWGLKIAKLFRIPLPVNEDNLNGLKANQYALHESSLL